MSAAKQIRALIAAEDHVKAWFKVNAALNEQPEDAQLLYLAGCVLRTQGHIGMSFALFAKALALEQKQPNLWMHYAASLHDLNQWDEAIQAFSVVCSLLPEDPMPPANIAASYTQKGLWHDALTWADKALSLDPENYIAHTSASFASLALGRWSEGWAHGKYLYGNHLVVRVYNDPEHEEPEWDGSPGKTVVVQADQGVGDIIMYSQCLLEMQRDCNQVIVECAARLVPLIKRNFPGLTVYGTLKDAGQRWSANHQIDAHIHISAIPGFYRTSSADFPRAAYLTSREDLVAKWRGWLAMLPRPWIGLSWRGGIQNTHRHLRSLSLEQLAPVMDQLGSFIDLSYLDNSAEVAAWNMRGGAQVMCPPVNQNDYEDTLALLAALDEVVTVTTAIVHACGAIGRHVRVLVPSSPTWRYAHVKDDGMIWYQPSCIEIFRQVPGEDWTPAIKALAKSMRPRILLSA